jgi:SAM-dependent methyltransferase
MTLIEYIHDKSILGRRARVLSQHLADLLPPRASVLDVGCGDGQIAWRIHQTRPDCDIRGIDVLVRDKSWVPVEWFDGERIPHEDRSLDGVMFVDVLHHTNNSRRLLRDAARVARQFILIKDHLREGMCAERTLRFMDRVGNQRHGVDLPFNYWSRREWMDTFEAIGSDVEVWRQRLNLYPWPVSMWFDRSLHFVARLSVGDRKAAVATAPCESSRGATKEV